MLVCTLSDSHSSYTSKAVKSAKLICVSWERPVVKIENHTDCTGAWLLHVSTEYGHVKNLDREWARVNSINIVEIFIVLINQQIDHIPVVDLSCRKIIWFILCWSVLSENKSDNFLNFPHRAWCWPAALGNYNRRGWWC